jgi:3D (Asp-Asp-Asp) domain-containing protein
MLLDIIFDGEEMDEFFQESEVQRLEGEVFELETQLKEHRDKERIYQDILTDINNSLIDLFKREEENNRFNFGEVTDYRQCMSGMKDYLDEIKRTYKGKIRF